MSSSTSCSVAPPAKIAAAVIRLTGSSGCGRLRTSAAGRVTTDVTIWVAPDSAWMMPPPSAKICPVRTGARSR
jgi:hypothetical protein